MQRYVAEDICIKLTLQSSWSNDIICLARYLLLGFEIASSELDAEEVSKSSENRFKDRIACM